MEATVITNIANMCLSYLKRQSILFARSAMVHAMSAYFSTTRAINTFVYDELGVEKLSPATIVFAADISSGEENPANITSCVKIYFAHSELRSCDDLLEFLRAGKFIVMHVDKNPIILVVYELEGRLFAMRMDLARRVELTTNTNLDLIPAFIDDPRLRVL